MDEYLWLNMALKFKDKSFLGNTSVATIPTLFDLEDKNKMEGFSLKKRQTYVFASVGAGMHCYALVYKS